MDLRGAAAAGVRIASYSDERDRRRSTARSNSQTVDDFARPREPMAIPGARFDDAPPPLPPPKYNEELAQGIDVAWSWGNRDPFSGRSKLAPIKPGSSLYGGYLHSRPDPAHRLHQSDEMEVDDDSSALSNRRASTVSTIRSPSQSDMPLPTRIPSLVRRAPSPSPANQRLHGEKPLAQENLNRSSQAYDQRVLSKIGKPNSPPRRERSDSTDSAVLAQKLSVQTKDPKFQRLSANELPSASIDPVSRWITSPLSAGLSPGSRPGWRDYNLDHRSPSMDSAATATSLVLDPELFVPSRSGGRRSTSGTAPGYEEAAAASFTNRSHRGSYDLAGSTESDMAGEEGGAFRNLSLGDSQMVVVERRSSKQGVKRRAPSDVAREDRSPSRAPELFPKLNTATPGRSPVNRYQTKHGSVSSTTSSARHNSYASSVALSVAGSSMTSISSFERHSPLDPSQPSPYITSAPPVSSPATSMAASRPPAAPPAAATAPLLPPPPPTPDNTSAARPMSIQTVTNDARLPPANRVGNYFICNCCPKKPKKFDTEEELRAHQMEKQYSCQFCHNRFKNKNEAERHQNSLHLRRHSWSCAAIPSYQAAFHPSTSPTAQGPAGPLSDTCGFCGHEFPNHPQPDWDRRIEHLTNAHKFGECNQAKKFYRADHFRQHLKHSHGGQSGKWTNMLENVCLREEPPQEVSGLSPTRSESNQGRGPSRLPPPADTPMGGATIDEVQEES